jgi:hypothetical protein
MNEQHHVVAVMYPLYGGNTNTNTHTHKHINTRTHKRNVGVESKLPRPTDGSI